VIFAAGPLLVEFRVVHVLAGPMLARAYSVTRNLVYGAAAAETFLMPLRILGIVWILVVMHLTLVVIETVGRQERWGYLKKWLGSRACSLLAASTC
jgi:hypothetical protein